MNLTPWKSGNNSVSRRMENEMSSLQREMNNLMSTFLTRWDSNVPQVFGSGTGMFPSIDLKEKDNKYTLDADLPGMSEQDIDIDFRNNTLILKGEKKNEKETKDENMVCVERSYGSFRRDIPFDHEIDQDNIKADLRNGVLHVELPMKEKNQTTHKKIPIKH